MELFSLIKREVEEPLRPLFIFITISGIASAFMISLINTAAENTSNSELNSRIFLLFIVGISLVILTKKYVLDRSVLIVEAVMERLRNRIAEQVRHTELNILESVGASSIRSRLNEDAIVISNTASNLVAGMQGAIMLIFTVLYIGTISLYSFAMVVGAFVIAFSYYFFFLKYFRTTWKKISYIETSFYSKVGHIIRGFKEMKINRRKNEGVFDNYKDVNHAMKESRVDVFLNYNKFLIFTQALFFILLGIILFIIPHFHAEHSEDVIKVTASILFIIGPFEGLITSIRYLDNANNSARNILRLEGQLLEELRKNNLTAENPTQPEQFNELPFAENIQLQRLSYAYPPIESSDHVFKVGPIDLTIVKGELIFITGGNGSGKSTFLKLLTGLYPPDSGRLAIDVEEDGTPLTVVSARNAQQYRNLFTTIFTDFHLFDKLYGVEHIDVNKVNEVLVAMELSADKVAYRDDAFTTLRLSSGQQKRLALTTSIIEDKPIYVFDEVAADLDPGFRDKFYYEILPQLKKDGKTVIVVSHDKHYWTQPDRLLEMSGGGIKELSREDIDRLLAIERRTNGNNNKKD
ncbi:MAG: cyclic peptide export ABC transporter [Bacteroidota bacterium]